MSRTARSNATEPDLKGATILVIEDEPFIAMDIADGISEAGGKVVGPALSIAEALHLMSQNDIKAGILDANLPDGSILPVIEKLTKQHAAMVIHTGAGLPSDIATAYPSIKVLTKPTSPQDLVAALLEAMS